MSARKEINSVLKYINNIIFQEYNEFFIKANRILVHFL